MEMRRKSLLASTAFAAGMVIAASSASAFDDVHWSWNNQTEELLFIGIFIDPYAYIPTGMTQLEQLQVNVGNVSASTNQFDTNVWIDVCGCNALDARYNLASVEGAATAIANLASVRSDAATYVHDGQFAFGAFDVIDDEEDWNQAISAAIAGLFVLPTGNQMTDVLAAMGLAAQFGLITPGSVTASANADYSDNVKVALDATAVGNLHSIEVEPTYTPYFHEGTGNNIPTVANGNGPLHTGIVTDSIVVADVTQFNYNNVSATASAKWLEVSDYSHLGANGVGPVSKLSATAIGNMSSVVNRVKLPAAQ